MPKGIEKEKENTMSEEEGGGGKEMTFDEFYQFDIKANHPNQQTCKIRIKFSKDKLHKPSIKFGVSQNIIKNMD